MDRRLYLMRHAKASTADETLSDHLRPLTTQGEEQARAMAAFLRTLEPAPTALVSSPATRALQTAEEFVVTLGALQVSVEASLYGATSETLLARLRALDDEDDAVLLIGHNPGLEDLLARLVKPGAAKKKKGKPAVLTLSTGALAVVRVPGRWVEMVPFSCTLERIVSPKDLRKPKKDKAKKKAKKKG